MSDKKMIPKKYSCRAIQGAYEKGWNAAKNGKKIEDNPYMKSYYQYSYFIRTFSRAWVKGYEDGQGSSS